MITPLTKEDVRGIISPLVTPFDEAEDVDLEAFRAEARHVLQYDVSGLLVGAAKAELQRIADALAAAGVSTVGQSAR